MSKHTPGPWQVQKVVVPYPRERFDPSRPYECKRQIGRTTERMRNDGGTVATFATEDEARAAITKAGGTT